MPDWRRNFVPGGTYFFTLVTDGRRPFLTDSVPRKLLGDVLRETQRKWPLTVEAVVLLPDHLHTIWSLPSGDEAYPTRIGWLKKEFTKRWLDFGGTERLQSSGRKKDGRRGIWQPKYWEHTVRDEDDYDRLFDYTHYNPVKHGHVRPPCDWPWSSFHRWVSAGVYDTSWGRTEVPPGHSLAERIAGEP